MELLNAKNITYFYDGTSDGVSNINFNGMEGDFIAIIGKNGAGKSTLLNMLSGIYLPQSGELRCSDDLNYHDFGICSQKQSIDWYLNVHDNIMLGAVLAGLNEKEALKATDYIAELLELSEFGKKSPDSLSGGQQQRLQVARALVHNPRVLILDEPTAGLDFHYSDRLFKYLKEKSSREGRLIFVSSHDLSLLEDYCDKILFLDKGKQLYFGEMKEFLSSHQMASEVTISYSGEISEGLRKELESEDVIFNDQDIVLNNSECLNEIILKLLKEVSITGLDSKKIGLKEIMTQNKEDINA